MKTSPVSPSVFFAFACLVAAAPAGAGEYESLWLEGARKFDSLHAGVIGRPQGGDYRGETRTQQVSRKAGQDDFQVAMEAPVYRVWTSYEIQLQSVVDYDCETVGGTGKGDWHGFFSAPKREKAERLADAIKGIGIKTARCAVSEGIFDTKPGSWRTFKERMKKVEAACGNGIYHQVVVTHGRENAQSLGYVSSERCTETVVMEPVLVEVEHKELSHMAKTQVRVSITGAPLLASEQETVNVSYDGFHVGVEASSRYNRFAVAKTGESDYVLQGSRLQTTPNNSLALEVLAGRTIRLTDTDHVAGVDAPQAQTYANLTVKQPRSLWFDKKLAEVRVPLTKGMATLELNALIGAVVPAGQKYYIEYSVTRANSVLNNGNASATKNTPEFVR